MKHAICRVLHQLGSVVVQLRCRRAYRRTCGGAAVAVPLACSFLAAILGLGLHVNLTASAPRGLYRAIAGPPPAVPWWWPVSAPRSQRSGVLEATSDRGHARAESSPF